MSTHMWKARTPIIRLQSLCAVLLIMTAAGQLQALAAAAQDAVLPGTEVKSEVVPSQAAIGDVIHYRISITCPDSFAVQPDQSFVFPEHFELLDRTSEQSRPWFGNSKTVQIDFTFACYLVGTFRVPELTFVLTSPAGTAHAVSSPPPNLEIVSLLTEEGAEMRDIKPPVDLEERSLGIILLIAAAVILSGVVVYLLVIRRKRARAAQKPRLPAHVVALKSLRDLQAAGLPRRGMLKLFYASVSEILRQYISARYGFPALEATTTEVLIKLKDSGLNGREHSDFQAQLELCDLVKFAKYIPPEEVTERAVYAAIEIVERTKAAPPPEEPGMEVRGDSRAAPPTLRAG